MTIDQLAEDIIEEYKRAIVDVGPHGFILKNCILAALAKQKCETIETLERIVSLGKDVEFFMMDGKIHVGINRELCIHRADSVAEAIEQLAEKIGGKP